MPLQVNVNTGTTPSPQIVAANTVVERARSIGDPNASRALAVTIPVCRVDQTKLEYEQRRNAGQVEFRFKTGILQLTLRQSIFIANNISGCAQDIWAEHEQDHATDNQQIMSRMERAIRAHRDLQSILISPIWRPRRAFNTVQDTIQSTVGSIFMEFTTEAVRSRDTTAVYSAVRDRIRRQCNP
ncbi:hypothetical protein [Sulfurirhabdus autotrophica]|uniref:Uncharacterized protein n=1 Tax=Sulfurirhabdus autotrophica TaxID=1706046 RepID=A0A4R3Y2H8_9PROT|nr:hypothetical protein [Sulfurirhabdus autotrophica]TCV85906.1 hypothetical protein EDC63_108114 [Sulfurirhabdus autotrophica]